MNKILSLLLFFILPTAFLSAVSTPDGWTDDFTAAKKQAVAEKKILVVNFTGTDWCQWCKKLEQEVFSKKEFVEKAKKNFVLVFIDIPSDSSRLSPLGRAQNKKIVDLYKIRSFPTVAIMDPCGVIIDRAGYQAGGVDAYIQMLNSKLAEKKDIIKKFRQIHDAKGGDKAKKIDAWLSGKSIEEQKIAIDWVNEMLKIDSRGSLGIRKKYAYFTDFLPISDEVLAMAGEYFAARKKFRESIPSDKKSDRDYIMKQNDIFLAKWKPRFDEMRKRIEAVRKKVGRNGDPRSFDELQTKIDFLAGTPSK